MNRKWAEWVAIALAATPAIVPLYLILAYGVDVPYWDQWDQSLGGLFVKAADGTLSLWDFTVQHNEHRIIVPRTIMFLLGLMTGWNTIAEMLLQWVVVCGTSVCVLWLARQTVGRGRLNGSIIFLWFLANLMIFTPKQHENWLWGMGLINVMPLLFFTAAMVVVLSGLNQKLKLGLAIALCAGAMFSLGSGILVFPLVGGLWAWCDSWNALRERRGVLIAWGIAFAVFLGMFVYGYSRPPVEEGLENKVVGMGDRLAYLSTFMGTQFTSVISLERETAGMIAGAILLALLLLALGYFAYIWLRCRAFDAATPMLPWCLMLLFVLLSALMATMFRTIVGLENAMSSRYVTFTLYVPVALIFLVPLIARDLGERFGSLNLAGTTWPLSGIWQRLPAVLGGALVMSHLFGLPMAIRSSEMGLYGRLKTKAALYLINILPDNPKVSRSVYPKVPYLMQIANRLDRLGYLRPKLLKNPDANQIRFTRYDALPPEKFGVFEQMRQSAPNVISAGGWVLWEDRLRPADTIILTYLNKRQEEIIFAASEGVIPRSDLALAKNEPRYELAGWGINFIISSLPSDFASVRITAWALDSEEGKVRPLYGHMNLTRDATAQP